MSYPPRPATLGEAVWFIGECSRHHGSTVSCSSELSPSGLAYAARLPYINSPASGEYVGRSHQSMSHALQSLAAALWDSRVPIAEHRP